ncbi:MAG TPA: response regulator [Candidatus Binatia bacterium]|nr:response regulator [Candidatus Binatia bacterium]
MNATALPAQSTKPLSPLRRLFSRTTKAPPVQQPPPVPVVETGVPIAPLGKKVLIVDDDPVIVHTTALKLKSAGYDALTARDASEAISVVRKRKPDLILLDVSFPPDVAHGGAVAWDGFLIMSWLRRIEDARRIPIVIITGGEPAKYKERALSNGAVGFFHKPLDHDELLSVIRRTLDQPGVGPGIPTQDFQI